MDKQNSRMRVLFTITGEIIHGDKRGSRLGFPTANIRLEQQVPSGIYASTITLEGEEFRAATFIGAAKTFEQDTVLSESYILDFNKEIYGMLAKVKFFKKIRENQKFPSAEALIKQMGEDVRLTRQFFNDESKLGRS